MADEKQEPPKKKKKGLGEFSENPITQYCHLVYRYFGRKTLNNVKFKNFFYKSIYNRKYESILKQANLKLLPEEYFVSVFLTMIAILGLIVFGTITMLIVNKVSALIIFYGGIGVIFSMGIFMYNYPVLLSKQRGAEIDAAIPYLLPYMKILGKELSLAKIIDIIDDFLIYKEIRVEFKKISYYTDFLGYDVHSAIREAMLSCPSKELSDLLNDMVTIANSGGDIYGYLERKLDNLNTEIDTIEKKNIDTLLIYSQIYVVILLIAPLFFTIMSAVLSLVEFSADTATSQGVVGSGGGSFSSIIILLFFLPFAYVGFMMLVFYSKPLYSRLVPIKNEKEK